MTTSAMIILCLFIGALFSRALLNMARWLVALAFLAAALKGLWLILPELHSLDLSNLGLGAFGGAVLMFFGFRLINNMLVNRDRANDHQGVDKKHDARLI